MESGFLYVATDSEFVEEAVVSAESIKDHMPDYPIAIVSDSVPENNPFDIVLDPVNKTSSFGDKVYNLPISPFSKTVYLDTDTYIAADVSELFDLLEYFDIAAAHNAVSYGLDGYTKSDEEFDFPECIPEYNTGMVAYRKHVLKSFFDCWKQEFQRDVDICGGYAPDQPSFRRALFKTDVRIATVPREYNCVFRRPDYVDGPVKIFHGRLVELDGLGARKRVDVRDAIYKLNKSNEPRVYDTYGRFIKTIDYDMSKPRYLFTLLYKKGLRETIDEITWYLRELKV